MARIIKPGENASGYVPTSDSVMEAVGVRYALTNVKDYDYDRKLYGVCTFSYSIPQKNCKIDFLKEGYDEAELEYKRKRAEELGQVYIAFEPGATITYEEFNNIIAMEQELINERKANPVEVDSSATIANQTQDGEDPELSEEDKALLAELEAKGGVKPIKDMSYEELMAAEVTFEQLKEIGWNRLGSDAKKLYSELNPKGAK